MNRKSTCLTALCFSAAGFAYAHDEAVMTKLEPVLVYGRGLELIGEAGAASEGVVGYRDFEDRALSRVGELAEVIPGVVATQHSGEGKANQFFLRGFNLDHGTDFSVKVDGVPVNLRTHGHGQGYLDLNFVIPELVERIDYRKGPYSAETGDFSSAGSADYTTVRSLREDFVEIGAGQYGYFRGVGAVGLSPRPSSALIAAVEVQSYAGPWELDQNLEKFNALLKFVQTRQKSQYSVGASFYDSSWLSTDQVPRRAVESGAIGRFGFIDGDLGGNTRRYALNGSASFDHTEAASTELNAYAVSYQFNLFSNFTYFLEDPLNGDEFEQLDERLYYGASLRHQRSLSDKLEARLGAEFRLDEISDIGLFRTAARERLSTTRRDQVEESSFAGWTEVEYALSNKVRVIGGVRADQYRAEVTGISLAANGGSADDSLVSPSFAAAWTPKQGVELFANYGRGFHSNDARGATIRLDPATNEPAERVPLLVKSEGREVGVRFESDRLKATVAAFQLELDSELVFVGDAGTTEPNDASIRQGIEASVFWTPTDWIVADLGGAFTDANFDIPGNETEIPGAVKSVVSGGVLARLDDFTLSARVRYFGAAPLIEDGSVESEDTTLVNVSANYDWRNLTWRVDIFNVFDSEEADISYFFESRLQDEQSSIADIHFHPVEPRRFRVSLRARF